MSFSANFQDNSKQRTLCLKLFHIHVFLNWYHVLGVTSLYWSPGLHLSCVCQSLIEIKHEKCQIILNTPWVNFFKNFLWTVTLRICSGVIWAGFKFQQQIMITLESRLIYVLPSYQVWGETMDKYGHSGHFCATSCYLAKSFRQLQARGTASLRQQCPDRVNGTHIAVYLSTEYTKQCFSQQSIVYNELDTHGSESIHKATFQSTTYSVQWSEHTHQWISWIHINIYIMIHWNVSMNKIYIPLKQALKYLDKCITKQNIYLGIQIKKNLPRVLCKRQHISDVNYSIDNTNITHTNT